jgi:YD repeat-containing protein
MAARVWSVMMAPKAALVLAMMAVLVGLGVSVAAPAGRAPSVRPVAAPELAAAERPPELGRLQTSAAPSVTPFTQWCVAPAGERVVPCNDGASSYAGEPGSYTFQVVNPTPDDVGYHVVVTCSGMPTTDCEPEDNLLYVASDGDTATMAIDWATPADTAGTLQLSIVLKPIATGVDTLKAALTVTVTIRPTYTVAVQPHASAVQVTQPKDTSVVFTVSNIGNTSATYTLVRHCTGYVSCTGTMPGTVSVGAHSQQPVTVPINSGSPGYRGTVSLTASTTGTADSGVVSIAPVSKAVAVSPAQEVLTMPAGIDTAVTFTVMDVGHAAPVTYHLTRTCAAPVTSCTGPDSVVVPSLNTPVNARVAYHTASGGTGGTGGVTLVATATTGPITDRSTGFARVTVPNTSDSLYATLATSPSAIERSTCLTVAAGPGAYLCGDLLLTHALPSARSMAKARTPVLVYASQTAAAPGAAEFKLGVDVHLKSGVVAPTALTGTLTLGTLAGCAQSWTTTGWPTGGVRRVVARCTGLALSQAATALPFTLQLTATINGHPTTRSLTGTAIVLARGSSAFGAGWSLAGLEQLYFPLDTTERLWVSGDGSARVYHRVAGSASTFVADSLDGPDSLTWNATTLRYTRWAPERLQIQFDQAGEHVATVNRLGQTTAFYWSSGRLDSLTVPPAAAHLTWHFTYTSGHLSSVTAPPGPSGARTVTVYVSQSPAQVDSIRDLDGTQVHFSYSGTSHLVTSVTDPLGHSTTFSYGAANTLASVTVPTDASHSLVTSFLPGEVAGVTGGAVVDPATVVSKVITPGADTTIVSLDRFGQPLTVRDPIGETTTITRGDTRWPALATRVTAPNGYTTAAAYDERGRVGTDTALAPLGGSNAITRYTYENTFDELTRVTGPTGEVWRATYDTVTGERLAEDLTDTGTVHETSYRYDATCQMVRAVTAPLTPSDSVVYDTRCNPQTVTSPGGAVTSVLSDGLGRVIRTTSPTGIVDSSGYDVMDRVVTKRTTGPTQNGVASQTVTVAMAYDALGRDTLVTRTMNPNPANISALTTHTGFDWASRTVRTTAPDGKVDSTHYNAAGDVDSVFTRLGGTTKAYALIMTYDKLHRLRKRVVPQYVYPEEDIGVYQAGSPYPWRHAYPMDPNVTGQTGYTAVADTAVFVYDSTGATAGRMTHANNGDAKVTRTYFANGAVATETDSVRTLKALGAGGGDFTHHIYTERYAYDLAGRLTTLVVPPQLAPRVQTDTVSAVLLLSGHARTVMDTVRYSYDTGINGTGWLTEIFGLLPGETFQYQYTPRGEMSALTAMAMAVPDGPTPLPLRDTRTYTADGALWTHQDKSGNSTLLRAASYTYDAESRVLTGSDSANLGQDLLNPSTMAFTYTGLGQLIAAHYAAQSNYPYTQYVAAESTTYDPLGNWATRNNVDQWAKPYSGTAAGGFSTLGRKWARYDPGSGRLRGDSLSTGATDTLRYDAAGNLHASLTGRPGSATQYNERVSYYALDGRLVAADARSGGGTYSLGHTAFEECRYDALGRRVWVRARRWCSDQSGAGNQGDETMCDLSTVRRTVWSGSSELAEIQMPAADLTPSDTVENDTLAVHRQRSAVIADVYYDANRFFGVVLDVPGPGLDQPVAVTRVNYADASDLHTGAVTYAVYAPFSLVGLWNNQGRVDRVVYGGTAAPGQTALCVDPGTQYRCVYPGID